MKKNKKILRVFGSSNEGYYGKLGKMLIKPKRGEAAEFGTYVNVDSLRRNARKSLSKRGIEVGSYIYDYSNASV